MACFCPPYVCSGRGREAHAGRIEESEMKHDMSRLRRAPRFVPVVILFCALVGAQPAHAVDAVWLQGVYYDSMNKLNLKEGVAFMGPPIEHKPRPGANWAFADIPFTYADVEAGAEGYKLTLGRGIVNGPEIPVLSRVGLSYAHFRTQNLAGLEAVLSAGAPASEGAGIPVGVSLKIGYYLGLAGTPNRLMIGLGMGL